MASAGSPKCSSKPSPMRFTTRALGGNGTSTWPRNTSTSARAASSLRSSVKAVKPPETGMALDPTRGGSHDHVGPHGRNATWHHRRAEHDLRHPGLGAILVRGL